MASDIKDEKDESLHKKIIDYSDGSKSDTEMLDLMTEKFNLSKGHVKLAISYLDSLA